MSLSYESSGVRYDQLDAFKRACQKAARTTAGELKGHGYSEPATTRGESAYLIEAADHFLAHVEEGLGTKNLVADAVYAATGKCCDRYSRNDGQRLGDMWRAPYFSRDACCGRRFGLVF
jgi:phosphoribosylformylglycinamidine cyclo-ligase